MPRLFTYGTLQLAEVQQALFGRLIPGTPAILRGFLRETIIIDDETVIGLSGAIEHAILRRTGDPAHRIDGTVYTLTANELQAADDYETDAYVRIEAMLADGAAAFVYARPEHSP